MSKWKVYISSTFRDLRNLRAVLIHLFQNQLKNSFELCEIMERMFDDGTYTPYVNDCVKAVLESDIYIVILGNRTGSFPPGEDRTYTEIELDTALANNKIIFCLRLEDFDEDKLDNKAKHKALLDKFRGRPVHKFRNDTEFENHLLKFLTQFAKDSPVNKKNPYKGLASFGVDDGDYFFGRYAELESCLKKITMVTGSFFVSVIGNSGTGKSSFVQAGLLFRLKKDEGLGFTDRKQVIVTPGSEPFTNLKYQLKLQGMVLEDLTTSKNTDEGCILLFDQFEEVITQCHSPEAQEEREQLFQFLDTLTSCESQDSKILVITTFRSDFLSQLANYDYIKSHQYLFPLSSLDYRVQDARWEESMVEIINRPALKNGVVIEKELVDQILNDLKEVEGSLPILQFTLERIWTKDTIADRCISSTEYNKLSEGKGISGIIETHAENVVNIITHNEKNKEREVILKSIFVNLVEVNENLRDVKRTVTKDELLTILKAYPKQIVNDVFEMLVSEKSRLLNVSQDKYETVNVGIIHEELIRKWKRLTGWINERREALEYKKRISLDIAAFNKGEEGPYGRGQLRRANRWSKNNPDLSNENIHTFLRTSKKQITARVYRQTGMIVLIAVILTTVIFAWVQPAIQKRDFIELVKKDINLNNAIQAVGGFDSLKLLEIDDGNYGILNGNLKHFNALKAIVIHLASDMADLSILKNIKNPSTIDSLVIINNENLINLSGIENLTALNALLLRYNNNLGSLKGIENLTALTSLDIDHNNSLTSLKGIENLTFLNFFVLAEQDNLTNLREIENLTTLDTLLIFNNSNLKSLKGIENLTALSSLIIMDNESLSGLKGIENLAALNHLQISLMPNLKSLKGIENLTALTSLEISDNHTLSSLKGIENLAALSSLIIRDNDSLISLRGIENLTALNSLEISLIPNLTSLRGIENLTALNSLKINLNNNLISLTGIEKLNSLRVLELDISGRRKHSLNLDALYELSKLEVLKVYDLSEIDIVLIKKNNPGVEIVHVTF